MPRRIHGIQGMTFGSMDAIIMVIGVVVGLGVTGNRTAVFIGVLVAGISNSFGNAWGFHISEETENLHSRREVWISTVLSFSGTLLTTFILILPVLLLPLSLAIAASVLTGLVLIVLIGLLVSRIRKLGRGGCLRLLLEYVGISLLVIVVAYYLGQFASGIML
jgi:VIT1/CCC1 family predicted Fe2+/Mn2+ transporter